MSASKWGGVLVWEGDREDTGHRSFKVSHLVLTDDYNDGPYTVMLCPDLPQIGDEWNFGNDFDAWAFCWPQMKVSLFQHRLGDPHRWWRVDQTFKTAPNPSRRCQDNQIENPLDEPDRISGSFNKYTIEAQKDRFGDPIKSSSHEMFRGQAVEFDANRPTVKIEQNVPDQELSTFSQMIDTLNDAPLWGLSERKIKLSNVSWERKYFGRCDVYYTRGLEFDIRYDGFDRSILDEGTKVLNGHWSTTAGTALETGWVLDDISGSPPDPDNPEHFIRYKDRRDECTRVILDGAGQPLADINNPIYRNVEYYGESNFLLLGIPTTL